MIAVGKILLGGIGAVLLVLAAGVPARAGAWIADAKSGCQVWDPNPQLEETVVWSGSCTKGHAEGPGTAQWLKAGVTIDTNQGSWRDGRQAGSGVQSWAGGRYQGEIADGEPNGRGVLTLKQMRYEGEFRDGKPNGAGRLTTGGDTVDGTWRDGCLQGGARKIAVGIPVAFCR